MSTVRSTPLVAHTKAHYEPGTIIGAIVGLIISGVVWIFGAKYTIDGLILIANAVLEFLMFSYRVKPYAELYLWLALFPLMFSAVEWTCSPIGKKGTRHAGLILTWSVIIVIDLVSTIMGLRAGGGVAFVIWLVSFQAGLAVLAFVLTFGPEWLMKSCGGLLWRAAQSFMKR